MSDKDIARLEASKQDAIKKIQGGKPQPTVQDAVSGFLGCQNRIEYHLTIGIAKEIGQSGVIMA